MYKYIGHKFKWKLVSAGPLGSFVLHLKTFPKFLLIFFCWFFVCHFIRVLVSGRILGSTVPILGRWNASLSSPFSDLHFNTCVREHSLSHSGLWFISILLSRLSINQLENIYVWLSFYMCLENLLDFCFLLIRIAEHAVIYCELVVVATLNTRTQNLWCAQNNKTTQKLSLNQIQIGCILDCGPWQRNDDDGNMMGWFGDVCVGFGWHFDEIIFGCKVRFWIWWFYLHLFWW